MAEVLPTSWTSIGSQLLQGLDPPEVALLLMRRKPYAMALLALTLWPSPASLQLSNVMIMLEEYGRFWKDALTVKLPSAQF